jgi:hypothetical protein
VRRRDPRRLLERRRRARARVKLLSSPSPAAAAGEGLGSKQVAEVTLPRAELDRIWTPEYLERLARTYWLFLTRVSLGLLRVRYTPDAREVVLLLRPLVLLRFRPPKYEMAADGGTVTWGIERGLLVAGAGRDQGYLRLSVRREDVPGRPDQVVAVVASEVVSFFPAIAARVGRWLYDQTQLRLHVIVTNAFLRSLANLELAPSRVGALSPGARPRSPAASPGRGER